MVIVKVLENKNKLFKALTMGLANEFVCNVIVDKQIVATLQPGEETTIELSQGSHKVFFKEARWGGLKSNKLVVNITPDNDYIIQAQNSMNGLVASYTSCMTSVSSDSIKCPNCGALNRVVGTKPANCEYCGTPLK